MSLTVTHRDLTKSYVRLREAADVNPSPVNHLLRFYSVECGLKAMALRERNAQTTAQQEDLHTHDLRQLAQALKLGGSAYRDLITCRRSRRGRFDHPPVEVKRLHEAWRYGAELDPTDEKRAVAGLTALGDLCEERIGR